jgi:hypothetical protein
MISMTTTPATMMQATVVMVAVDHLDRSRREAPVSGPPGCSPGLFVVVPLRGAGHDTMCSLLPPRRGDR